jgi:uncharacterized protein
MANAYLIDVAPILETLGGSMEIRGNLAIEALHVGTETFEPCGDAHIDLSVTNCGGAVVVMGSVSVVARASCARCLRPFELPISGEVDGFYVHPGCDGDVPDEQEVEYIDPENRIDVLPAILSALVLDVPLAPLHDEECAGICPKCGTDLNEASCDCDKNDDRSGPFAALRGLLESQEDGETRQ